MSQPSTALSFTMELFSLTLYPMNHPSLFKLAVLASQFRPPRMWNTAFSMTPLVVQDVPVDHRGLISLIRTSRYTHKCILHSIRVVRTQVKTSRMKGYHRVLHDQTTRSVPVWRHAPIFDLSMCHLRVLCLSSAVSRSSRPAPDLLTVC